MNELEKYAIATIALIVFLLGIAFLSQMVPAMIERALPL